MFDKTTKDNNFIPSHSQIHIDLPTKDLQARIMREIDRHFFIKASVYHLSKNCDGTFIHAKRIHTYLSLALCDYHIREQAIRHLYQHISHYSTQKFANNHKSQCDGWCLTKELDISIQNTSSTMMKLRKRMKRDFPNIIIQLEDE